LRDAGGRLDPEPEPEEGAALLDLKRKDILSELLVFYIEVEVAVEDSSSIE
jgi:hypothetical protein